MRYILVSASAVLICGNALFFAGLPQKQGNSSVVTATEMGVATTARIRYPANHYPTFALPTGEQWPVRSVLNTRHKMQFGDYLWNDVDVPSGPAFVRIDLSKQTLSLFRGGHEIGSTVVLFGTDGKPTPIGIFPVIAMARAHRSSLYDAEMPFMLRLTSDGVALHASHVREGSATHGCIGVPLAFAKLLYSQMRLGDRVLIVRS